MNACDIKGIVCLAKVTENPVFLCPSPGFRGKLTLKERFASHLRPKVHRNPELRSMVPRDPNMSACDKESIVWTSTLTNVVNWPD